MSSLSLGALAAILTVTVVQGGAAQEIVLARGGKALAAIVAPSPDEVEQFAAAELARYLGSMAACTFPIVPNTSAPQDVLICVGTPASLASSIPEQQMLLARARGLSEDAFLIHVGGSRVVILGSSPRATLYGVYDLLEDDLGACWTVPGPEGEFIPAHDPLTLSSTERVETPAFALRGFDALGSGGAQYADNDAALIDWVAKRKLNLYRMRWIDNWDNLEPRLLAEIRKRGLMSGCANHSFGKIVPPERYAQGHPEFYALRDGERATGGSQLCTTNPEVVSTAARELADLTARYPEFVHIGMLQGDGWAFCQCKECAGQIEGQCDDVWPGENVPQASALILKFVNDVNHALQSRRSGVSLWFDAYSPTIEPPAALQPGPDVNVFVWLYWRCCLHSLGDQTCTRSRQYATALRRWREITSGRMMVTDYWCGLTQPVPWWPTLTTMKQDYEFLREIGVDGAAIWGLPFSWFKLAELDAYLDAELLWNLDQGTWEVVQRFCNGRYGAAAHTMLEYYREIARGMQRAADENPRRRVANTWHIADMYVLDAGKLRALIDQARAQARSEHASSGVEDARVKNEYTILLAEVGAATASCDREIEARNGPAASTALEDLRRAVNAFSAFFEEHRQSGMYYGTPRPLQSVLKSYEQKLEGL